jgi:hypothetical protein
VGLTPQQRLQRISEIVESRKERYEQADIILENERTPAEAVAAICEALSVNGESTGGVNIVHVPLGETCAVPGWRRSCSASLPARLLRASAQRRCSTVDSSVGGKTGVNHPLGKNLIGTFYQPRCVFIDPEVLRTLPERERWSGLAEVMKYGLIRDPALWARLEENLEGLVQRPETLSEVIARCCAPGL